MSRDLLILTSGGFGADVARRLTESHPAAVREIGTGTHPSLWPHAELIVLATSHERPRIAEALDRAAFAWRVPWFAVHVQETELRCGPVIVPGRTACYRCFVRRRDQHRRPGQVVGGQDRHPSGHPDHHVGIAAAFARQAIAEAFDGPAASVLGATIRGFDQVSGATSRSSVVAVDRCPRCRTQPSDLDPWQRFAAIDEGTHR